MREQTLDKLAFEAMAALTTLYLTVRERASRHMCRCSAHDEEYVGSVMRGTFVEDMIVCRRSGCQWTRTDQYVGQRSG